MGIDQFEIIFDIPNRSYFPGHEVKGRLRLTSGSDEKCMGIKITFTGEAKVKWTESIGSGGQQIAYSVSDSQEYFKEEKFVLGDGKEKITIPAGQSEYPFSFLLPKGLPSTLIGEHGNICYEVIAAMKRSWKFDRIVKELITVNGIVDLNNDPGAARPGEFVAQKNIGCFICMSGSVGFALSIPKKGYVPGEYIEIEAETRNHSSRDILSIKLALMQETIFYAKAKTKTVNTLITFTNISGVNGHQSDVVTGKLLQIPPVPPSIRNKCKIIDVSYKLEATVSIKGPSFNLRGSVPLVIGTIPYKRDFARNPSAATIRYSNELALNDDNISPTAPPQYLLDYPELPAPTYASAIIRPYSQGKDVPHPRPGSVKIVPAEIKATGSTQDFVPVYITWASMYQN